MRALYPPRHTATIPNSPRTIFGRGIAVRDGRLFLLLLIPPPPFPSPNPSRTIVLVATRSSAPRVALIPVRSPFSLLAWPLAASYVRAIISDRDDEAPGTAAAAVTVAASRRRATPRNGSDGRVGFRPTRRVK